MLQLRPLELQSTSPSSMLTNKIVVVCVHNRRAVGAISRCSSGQKDLLGQAAARSVLKVLYCLASAFGHHLTAAAAASPAIPHANSYFCIQACCLSGEVAATELTITKRRPAPHSDIDLVEYLVRLVLHKLCNPARFVQAQVLKFKQGPGVAAHLLSALCKSSSFCTLFAVYAAARGTKQCPRRRRCTVARGRFRAGWMSHEALLLCPQVCKGKRKHCRSCDCTDILTSSAATQLLAAVLCCVLTRARQLDRREHKKMSLYGPRLK